MFAYLAKLSDQLWELVSHALHSFLNPNVVLTLAVLAIASYFIYSICKFMKKIKPVANNLAKANEIFNFEANHEQYFYQHYEEISTQLESIPMMSHHWHEFKEHLIEPSEAEAADLSHEELKINNSLPPSFFFSEEKLIERPIDLRSIDSIPGKLVALGVLFTFVGLTIGIASATYTLGGLDGALDTPELNKTLMMLLKGASLAFISSVVGIALSLGFSWIEKHKIKNVKKSLNSFVDSLEKCMSFVTSEQIHLQIKDATVEQNKKLDGFSNELAIAVGNSNKLAIAVGNAVAGSISTSLNETFSKMADNIEELKNIQQNFSEKLMRDLVDKMSGNISSQAQQHQQQAVATFTGVQQAFSNVVDRMDKQQQEIHNTIKNIADNNASTNDKTNQIIANFEKLLVASNDNIKENHNIQTAYKDIVDRQQDIVTKFYEVAQAIDNANANISATSRENQAAASAFRESANQVNNLIQGMSTMWQAYDQKFKDTDEAMNKNFKHFESHTNQFQQKIEHYVNELTKEFEKAVSALGDQLEELADTREDKEVRKLENCCEEIVERLDRIIRK